MYISCSEAAIPGDRLEAVKTELARVHEFMRTMAGFRWAMLLRSQDEPDRVAAISMWLTPEQATAENGGVLGSSEEVRGYDVTTARGSMTPASHVALADWHVEDVLAARFTNRWNAAYHAIEDRLGSRLLTDLATSGHYIGLHAVTDEANLRLEELSSELKDADGMSVRPGSVHRYEVVLLTEV